VTGLGGKNYFSCENYFCQDGFPREKVLSIIWQKFVNPVSDIAKFRRVSFKDSCHNNSSTNSMITVWEAKALINEGNILFHHTSNILSAL